MQGGSAAKGKGSSGSCCSRVRGDGITLGDTAGYKASSCMPRAAKRMHAGGGGWLPEAGEPAFRGSEVQAGKTRRVLWVDGGDATGRNATEVHT